jgi:RNA polymerase sigma-70 factor (ECF subfamily)
MSDHELEFQQIHDTFCSRIFNYLSRMVGEDEAEDLTQEVFTKISQSLNTFKGDSRVSTWIYKIATNAALDRLRSATFQQARKNRLTIDAIEESAKAGNIWTGEKTRSSEQQIIQSEMNACIRNVINKLPEGYRTVIVLSDLEGVKDKEIAEIIGLILRATKIKLHRARSRLKEELARYCVFYRDDRNELACDLQRTFRDFRKEYFS